MHHARYLPPGSTGDPPAKDQFVPGCPAPVGAAPAVSRSASGDAPAHLLTLATRGGVEGYFVAAGGPAETDGLAPAGTPDRDTHRFPKGKRVVVSTFS